MAILDGTKTYLNNKSILEEIGACAVEFSNAADRLKSSANYIVSKIGGKTQAQIEAMGIPSVIAADIVKIAVAAQAIIDTVNAQVTAGNLANGQFSL